MGKTSDKRLKKVLSYKNEHGVDATCEEFGITASTIRRHERRAKNRGLKIGEEYEGPKILVFDLETAPLQVYSFGTGKQYISHEHIEKERSLLSYSAKWLCESEVRSDRATVEEAKKRDDERLVNDLWDLLHEADILIGHNLDRFDTKVANSRFKVNDLDPPSPYQTIDTYKQIRKNFDFTSNSLDYLTATLCKDKEDKGDHSMMLWKRCVTGDESALKEMEEYNRKDVRITEDLYFETRAYYTSCPNMALYYENMGDRCTHCESTNLVEGENSYYTSTNRYKTQRCKDCGAISRERHGDVPTDKRKELRRTLAR